MNATPKVLLACARAAEIPARDWAELDDMLDADERGRSRRLRLQADRHAFVLAHALLRALVGAETQIAPASVRIARDAKGRPFVAGAPELHVSLSRSRELVACAASRAAPVGVDTEPIDGKPPDAGLLSAFVATHEAVTPRQFFFHWTALEAFWKACGTGLADGHPRICCVPRTGGRFDVHFERSTGGIGPCAGRGAIVDTFPDCALAVVLRAPAGPHFVLKRMHCEGALDIHRLARARLSNERFCAA